MKPSAGYTLFDFLVYLIESRKFLRFTLVLAAIPMGGLFLTGLALWWFLHPRVEPVGDGTLSIKMSRFTPEVFTLLVHPHGWQDTGITVSPQELLSVRASGQTNMGLDVVTIAHNAELVRKFIDEVTRKKVQGQTEEEAMRTTPYPSYEASYRFGWPWIGPEGYDLGLPQRLSKIPSTFSSDTTLSAHKYPPGRLIGCVRTSAPSLSDRIPDDEIIDFALKEVSIPDHVPREGRILLAVNDSKLEEWQYDNFGVLMITIRREK